MKLHHRRLDLESVWVIGLFGKSRAYAGCADYNEQKFDYFHLSLVNFSCYKTPPESACFRLVPGRDDSADSSRLGWSLNESVKTSKATQAYKSAHKLSIE